ncbi:DUF6531 domain-containing protein [Sorangium sp. So ce1000]|uniref:DUF6531 domain-containing protein n=1 Tax=Sorangium sp. So ce1000 TaxID=3133325 RepID=UPI003F5E9942
MSRARLAPYGLRQVEPVEHQRQLGRLDLDMGRSLGQVAGEVESMRPAIEAPWRGRYCCLQGPQDPNRYPECGTVSHPIDVVTGRVFTHAIPICALPGPLQFVWERSYSSAMADRDAGFG